MIRKRYNRIPRPAQETKQERNINTKCDIKYETAQAKGQEDSSFPANSAYR